MSMHERLNRGQDVNSDQMMEDTQIYHVPSVGDDPPPSHRSSRRRDHYRRPQVVRDDYDDDFYQVYQHPAGDDERSRSRPKRYDQTRCLSFSICLAIVVTHIFQTIETILRI